MQLSWPPHLFGALVVITSLLTCPVCAEGKLPEAYVSLWRDADLNRRIDQAIEKHRKGDMTLELVNRDGQPIPNAQVEVRQIGHEFLFGCNAFVLGQLDTPEQNRLYEGRFLKLFNSATVPFYWHATEPTPNELRYQEQGSRHLWRRPPPDRFLGFAEKHQLTLKGHPLLYHGYNPGWLPVDREEVRRLYQKRFKEIAGRYADKIKIWDGVNESLECQTNFALYTPDRSYVGWAFDEQSRVFPKDCMLLINEITDFNFKPAQRNAFLSQTRKLLSAGKRIQGVGLQCHFFRREALDEYVSSAKSNPTQLLELYDEFGNLGLPLYITEITIPSAGEGGEALQAEVVRDLYRLWFSVPAMAGITWWNLGDGTAIKGENEAKGGIVDNELSPKPAYEVLDRLINAEWKTQQSIQSNDQGRARFRGFYGRYQLKIMLKGKAKEIDLNHVRSGPGTLRLVL